MSETSDQRAIALDPLRLDELRRRGALHAAPAPPTRPRRDRRRQLRRRRRRSLFLLVVVLLAVGVAVGYEKWPRGPVLTPLESRIVTTAESQLGYETSPTNSYCNRFSYYWHSGADDCGSGLLDEEWCADFAAWVWRQAGVHFVYGLDQGELNSQSASFYSWGVAHGTWHPIGDGYVPKPGDVAVYGLDVLTMTAVHVAIVTSYTPGDRGPNVVNGDGARTAFSIVETGTDQWHADIHSDGGPISGYVSPTRTAAAPR